MMRGGDKAAFGVLFDRYYDLLHTFARHIVKDSSVAEDIIQNVFVKMWMRKEQVNPELSVRNYLLVATRNELFDYMRLRYNMLRSDINDAMLNVADGDTDIYDYVDVRERVGFIDSVMRSMPDKRREIFAMRYDRNMTNAEIARALNLSIRTVEKHVDLAMLHRPQTKRRRSSVGIGMPHMAIENTKTKEASSGMMLTSHRTTGRV